LGQIKIRVGITCGVDGGDELAFGVAESAATWRVSQCCTVDATGGLAASRGERAVKIERLGDAAPARCRTELQEHQAQPD
jgi:hypothetical protein